MRSPPRESPAAFLAPRDSLPQFGIKTNRSEFCQPTAGESGVAIERSWLFSALNPFPLCHLPLPLGEGRGEGFVRPAWGLAINDLVHAKVVFAATMRESFFPD